MKKLLLTIAACAALTSAGNATVLVNETFADGNRTNQNPPNSLAWYSSAGTANLTVSGGVMWDNTPNTTRGGVAYFNAVTLTIGQTLDLSFDLTAGQSLTGGGYAGGFIIGLFDSKGLTDNIQTADGSQPAANISTGFSSNLYQSSAGSGTQYLQLQERTGATGGTLMAAAGLAKLNASGPNTNFLTTGETYSYGFSIERTGETEAVITMTISGGDLTDAMTLSFTKTGTDYFTFDTIGFSNSSSATTGMQQVGLSNIQLTLIPEPSAAALLAGALGLLLVARRRR